MKTLIRRAWKNASQNRGKPSRLLLAIEKALSGDHRAVYRFAKQIAHSDTHGKIAALGYHSDWKGRWQVRNSDLDFWGDFLMWWERENDPEHRGFEYISAALKHKRLQQALNRYKKSGLTKDHCTLIENALWEVDTQRGDWISIFVQGKRPFGDSSRAGTIYRLLGWPLPEEDRSLTDREAEMAWNIFDELIFAIPDAAKLAAEKLAVKSEAGAK